MNYNNASTDNKPASVWTVVLRTVIALATAILGILGGTEVYAALAG